MFVLAFYSINCQCKTIARAEAQVVLESAAVQVSRFRCTFLSWLCAQYAVLTNCWHINSTASLQLKTYCKHQCRLCCHWSVLLQLPTGPPKLGSLPSPNAQHTSRLAAKMMHRATAKPAVGLPLGRQMQLRHALRLQQGRGTQDPALRTVCVQMQQLGVTWISKRCHVVWYA
jgi:hypothetical protein